jgi:hypothetical protein
VSLSEPENHQSRESAYWTPKSIKISPGRNMSSLAQLTLIDLQCDYSLRDWTVAPFLVSLAMEVRERRPASINCSLPWLQLYLKFTAVYDNTSVIRVVCFSRRFALQLIAKSRPFPISKVELVGRCPSATKVISLSSLASLPERA